MSSNINPANIDGSFPVAGQDNDSQGFRDNFTNTKNNFSFAKSDIEALQLSSASLAALNDFSGNIIQNAELRDNSKTVFAKGTLSGTVTFDHTQGHIQTVTTAGNVTLAFTNFPANLKHGSILVVLTVANTTHNVLLAGSVTTPPDFTTAVDGAGTYWYEFISNDGGNTFALFDRNRSYGTNTGNIDISTNVISTTTTNVNLLLAPNGTGTIELQKNTNVTGNLIATGNLGGTLTTAAQPNITSIGNLTSLVIGQITINGNNITTNTTNANIELNPSGTGTVEFRVSEQTTVGAAGGASALPGAPLGYVQFDVNGRAVVMPFYSVS